MASEGKASVYLVIRRYQIDASAVEEIIQRAEQGFVPMIKGVPGFVSYTLGTTDDGRLITVSTFQDRVGADQSVQLARQWVAQNLASLVPDPPEILGGEVLVREDSPAEQPRYFAMRRYRTAPGAAQEIGSRAQAEFVPILKGLPGFARYVAVDLGNDDVVSFSGFRDREAAMESSGQAADWVRKSLMDLLAGPPEITNGTMRVFATA